MKKQLILILVFTLIISISADNAYGATHYVDPDDFMGVIANANDGDTIVFNNGFYDVNRPINLLDSLRLVARNPGAAILRATRDIHAIIDVLSPGVTISDLVLDGNHRSDFGIHGGYGGYYAYNSNFNHNTIINNKLDGIMLNNTHNSVFSNNYIENNGVLGIGIYDSPNCVLTGNQVTHQV